MYLTRRLGLKHELLAYREAQGVQRPIRFVNYLL